MNTDQTLYLGYYNRGISIEAMGILENKIWNVYISNNDHPQEEKYLFSVTSLDEAYDSFYEWIDNQALSL